MRQGLLVEGVEFGRWAIYYRVDAGASAGPSRHAVPSPLDPTAIKRVVWGVGTTVFYGSAVARTGPGFARYSLSESLSLKIFARVLHRRNLPKTMAYSCVSG
jgi:hypothetical protein